MYEELIELEDKLADGVADLTRIRNEFNEKVSELTTEIIQAVDNLNEECEEVRDIRNALNSLHGLVIDIRSEIDGEDREDEEEW